MHVSSPNLTMPRYSQVCRVTGILISRFFLHIRWIASGNSCMNGINDIELLEVYATTAEEDMKSTLVEQNADYRKESAPDRFEDEHMENIERVRTVLLFCTWVYLPCNKRYRGWYLLPYNTDKWEADRVIHVRQYTDTYMQTIIRLEWMFIVEDLQVRIDYFGITTADEYVYWMTPQNVHALSPHVISNKPWAGPLSERH